MKLCRITHRGFDSLRFALIEGSTVLPFKEGSTIEHLDREAQVGKVLFFDDVNLFARVTASKIVCVGRNYREHAAELGNKMPDEPLLFLKAPSAIIGPGDCIELPSESQQVEHE